MDVFLAITQGAGLAAATGIRPFLPALLAGALARADLGMDFDGTDYAFLERGGFLLAVVVALVIVVALERRLGPARLQEGALGSALAGLGAGVGALLFAGSLSDVGAAAWPGLAGGLACALLAQAAARRVFGGASARLEGSAQGALPVYADGASLAVAGAAVLAPPVSLLVLAALARIALAKRRREGEKYAGLRVLR